MHLNIAAIPSVFVNATRMTTTTTTTDEKVCGGFGDMYNPCNEISAKLIGHSGNI